MNYEPSAWQREFHALNTDEALGGGAAGPGKSLALLMDPMEQIVVEHERCAKGHMRWGESQGWAIHLRREFPRLKQTMRRADLLFPKVDPGVKWSGDDHMWIFSSGYRFQFGHLKDNDTFLNYRSSEFTHLGIDELGEIDEPDVWHELVGRVRTTDPVLAKMLKARAVSNPFPNWVRDYFVDPAPGGRKIIRRGIANDNGEIEYRTRVFLPAKLDDNPSELFRREYKRNLRDKPAHIRAMLLDGDWYASPGAYFAECWDPSLVVIKPYPIPLGWRRFRTADWGYKSECVILWWAVTPDRELICYRERTFNGPKARVLLDAVEVAEKIKEIEKANGEWNNIQNRSRLTGFMDNQLWEERGHRGPTMASDMAAVGVHWQRATKGRLQAAQQLVKRLKQRGYNGRPGIMFFETCIKCISTIPAIGTDKDNPEVPQDGGPDHWLDATMYACAATMSPSGRDDRKPDRDEDEDEAPPVDRGRFGYGAS